MKRIGNKRPTLQKGTVINNFTVLDYITTINKCKVYSFKCVCGNIIESKAKYIKNGDKKSCGCISRQIARNDLTGKKFGRLTALGLDKDARNKSKWICLCECGIKKSILTASLESGKSKSCGCLHKEIVKNLHQVEKYEEVPLTFLKRIQESAKRRNLECSISVEDIWNIYIKQSKKCLFTKQKIGFCDDRKKSNHISHTASLDRLDSTKGYIKENCCLVHKDINFMKQNFTVEQFIKYCKLIIENYECNDPCRVER